MKALPFKCYLYPLFFVLALGCSNAASTVSTGQTNLVNASWRQEPLEIPHDSMHRVFDGLISKEAVVKHYRRYGPDPVWIRGTGYSPLADSLILMLHNIRYYGFPYGSFHMAELDALESDLTRDGLIRKDILLTDAFLSLSHALKHGITNSAQQPDDSLQIGLLNSALTRGEILQTLRSQEPSSDGYTSLKRGLGMLLDSLADNMLDSGAVEIKSRLISINLERWRAENQIAGRYIFVNIPSFTLDVFDGDSLVLSSRVIVGKPENQTPVLSSKVECFTIYPYWHVPRKISVEEYLPLIKEDVSFLSKNNFDVLNRRGEILNPDSIHWNAFNKNNFPVTLRQREGPENSLGIIKFVFDNPYAVFLHDTNARRLFRSKKRAFSHGCIRMERATELAHYLVTGRVNQRSPQIDRFLKEKTQHRVELNNPIPIYVRYYTCEFRNNIFYTYDDVYARDKELYALMWGNNWKLEL